MRTRLALRNGRRRQWMEVNEQALLDLPLPDGVERCLDAILTRHAELLLVIASEKIAAGVAARSCIVIEDDDLVL